MITPQQRDELSARAYIPEHLPDYVTAISKTEPFLRDEFLLYFRSGRMIFVGYPLEGPIEESRIEDAIAKARKEFNPSLLAITSPVLPASILRESRSPAATDNYFRLDLDALQVNKKLRNLLKRSQRDLEVRQARSLHNDHHRLIKESLRNKNLDRDTKTIFKLLPDYVRTSNARIFEARTRDGHLAAFDIADFSAGDYGFYLFNFCSRSHYVPGSADLLLWAINEHARQTGKRYVNMGLGINPGVQFFKTKWGAQKFLPHCACVIEAEGEDILDSLLDAMF